MALSVRGLRKAFGAKLAVAGIDLDIPHGCFFGLVGPNGAGKTTTLGMVTGLLRPDAGSVAVDGVDVWRSPPDAKRRIGVLPEDLRLFDRLSGQELLTYNGLLRGMQAATVAERSRELLDVLDLRGAAGTLVVDYSHGMRKKIALAAALLHNPRVLFLDEPFEAIDPVSARTIRAMLERYTAGGATVVFSSHVMELVERLCDRVGIMHQGRLIAEGPIGVVRGARSLEDAFVELVAAGGFVALAALRAVPSDVAEAVAVVGFVFLALAWALLPLLTFAADSALDPAKLVLLPLRPRQLATGLFVASCVGLPPLATLAALSGAVVGFGPAGPGLVVVVLAVVLEFALCVLAARALTTALSRWLRSRRVRDLAIVVVSLGALTLNLGVQVLVRSTRPSRLADLDWLRSLGRALGWLPPGLAARAMATAGRGGRRGAAARLVVVREPASRPHHRGALRRSAAGQQGRGGPVPAPHPPAAAAGPPRCRGRQGPALLRQASQAAGAVADRRAVRRHPARVPAAVPRRAKGARRARRAGRPLHAQLRRAQPVRCRWAGLLGQRRHRRRVASRPGRQEPRAGAARVRAGGGGVDHPVGGGRRLGVPAGDVVPGGGDPGDHARGCRLRVDPLPLRAVERVDQRVGEPGRRRRLRGRAGAIARHGHRGRADAAAGRPAGGGPGGLAPGTGDPLPVRARLRLRPLAPRRPPRRRMARRPPARTARRPQPPPRRLATPRTGRRP